MLRVLSLFDYSGQWPEPFAAAGWDVVQMDIKHGNDINEIIDAGTALEMFEHVNGILAAPPCTDFTNSGAQYWKRKDQDGTTAKALELVYQVQRLADLFLPTDPDYIEDSGEPFFWALENPVGRLPKLVPGVGQAYYFNPCDFAGYLGLTDSDHNELDRLRRKDGIGITPEESDFILEKNAYTKKTGIWGEFNREIPKDPIEPVKACKAGSPLMRYGGKTEATKAARSNTPLGFALAFFQANEDHVPEYDFM